MNETSSTTFSNKQIFLRIATLESAIEYIGKNGNHVFVRYDPVREKYKFTVVINQQRLGDTDEPLKLLKKYIDDNFDEFNFADIAVII